MPAVLLTADRTLMSNYHNNEVLKFGTCALQIFVPEWLYSYLFLPSATNKQRSRLDCAVWT
jgi:hypothetical protein